MRKVIAAALLLSPMLLHAQANSPAQPESSIKAAVLVSKLMPPNAFSAVNDTDHSAASTVGSHRVSTGVTEPKLIQMAEIASDGSSLWQVPGAERTAVVSMVVDEKGVPSELKIVQSVGPLMDRNILAAVRQYRYQPGTLDHHPTAVPVNLEIVIRKSVQ